MAQMEIEGKLYRSLSLDEWMSQLAADHPAVDELRALRGKLAQCLVALDSLEEQNAALTQELLSAKHQPKEKTV